MSAVPVLCQSTVLGHGTTVSSIWYHTYTLWLFVVNDVKSIVLPSAVFAFAQASKEDGMSMHDFALRFPKTVAWILVNLLAFSINNQRRQSAITEDGWNKPWRPLPSGRLTVVTAKRLGWSASILAFAAGSALGGGSVQGVLIAALSHGYNDAGMGNRHWLMRNILNGAGISSFAAGALSVAQQSPMSQGATCRQAVMAIVIGTTIHIQDLYDQAGDDKIGRRTIPLIIGDSGARWTIGVSVMLWSVVVPLVDGSGLLGRVCVIGFGLMVMGRTLVMKAIEDDIITFWLYNVWLMAIYVSPLTADE